ncbi:MAG: methylglyoxal synthase [Lachnospiraceae bacterium]|nr:methylglyoxal synthase [Lachnospiraceae bacterium]
MNIGLIADDARKVQMQNICIAYKHILKQHELYSTFVTGDMIEKASNLTVNKLHAGTLGGEQQMAVMVENGLIDLVIFLKAADEYSRPSNNPWMNRVIPLCNKYEIPLATNMATAEVLIRAIGAGLYGWVEEA